jgi:hypothetical protein
VNDPAAARTEIQATLDHEVDLVMSGVNLVASGAALSATIGGLRLLDVVLEIVRPRAGWVGVTLEPLLGPGETVTDVRVTRESVEAASP